MNCFQLEYNRNVQTLGFIIATLEHVVHILLEVTLERNWATGKKCFETSEVKKQQQ